MPDHRKCATNEAMNIQSQFMIMMMNIHTAIFMNIYEAILCHCHVGFGFKISFPVSSHDML